MATTNERIEHTMKALIGNIMSNMGWLGGDDDEYREVIARELGVDLQVFCNELRGFYDKHPYGEFRVANIFEAQERGRVTNHE